MAGRRDEHTRPPQFSETQYEIPPWQTVWNKPWYQRADSSNSEQGERKKHFKYNSRGHLIDCTCFKCEEDLETAFSPQSNPKRETVFDIPKDRREEITIHDDAEDEQHGGEAEKPNASCSNASTSGPPNRVLLLSDLAEVTPTTPRGNELTARSSNASSSRTSTRTTASPFPSMTHDSVMEGFGNLAAIQEISEQTKDIQTRVRDYHGKSDTEEYKTMKRLLLCLWKELSRINSSVEWFSLTKKMALEAIAKTLEALEKKVKEAES